MKSIKQSFSFKLILLKFTLIFAIILFGKIVNAQEEKYSIEFGRFFLDNNNLPKAEETFQGFINSLNSVEEKSKAYFEIAKLYNTFLYFDLSILYCQEMLNSKGVSNVYRKKFLQLITVNHIDLNNLDQAENYFWKAEEYKSQSKKEKASDQNLIGEINRLKNKSNNAIDNFSNAISINKQIDNFEGLAMNYNNLGLVYLELQNYTTAEKYLNTSLRIIDSLDLKNRKVAIDISYGRLYQAQKKYLIAIDYFKNTINNDLQNHSDKTELLRDAHKGLSQCFDEINDSKNALKHYKEYQVYNQKIFDREKQSSIFERQILIEKERHKEELKLISERSYIEKKNNRIYFALLCVGIVLLSLVILLLRLRNKSMRQKVKLAESNNKIQQLEIATSKATNERLQGEIREKEQLVKIEELEFQKLKDEIDFKNRELTSFSIHICNKNEILTEIDSQIKSIEDWGKNQKLKELTMLIKQNLQFDQDWDIFKMHFIEVHPDFFKTIIDKFPDLTNDDLKLCAYLKLQLSSKEIARLLNIESAAVNKRRNRIRKKLDIGSSIDLHEFMLTIDRK